MALLLLVRHAVTDVTGRRLSGQAPGMHLSEAGSKQAERLAERLADVPLAAAYSSPLERCMETAEIAVRGRGLKVEPLQGLLEVDYGKWTGRPLAQLYRTRTWKQLQAAPSSVRFPGGESLADVQRRCVSTLEEVASRHASKAIAVFAHADVIRLSLAHFAGVHIDHYQRLIVSPASVSAVLLGDRVPRILRMNDTGSLKDLAAPRRPRSDARRPPQKGGRLP